MFLTTGTGLTLAEPTLILSLLTLASCCFVPNIRNSALSSFSVRLFNISQLLTSLMQSVIDFIAASASADWFGLKETYSCASSAWQWTCGRWCSTISNSLRVYMVKSSGPKHNPWGTPWHRGNFLESPPLTNTRGTGQINTTWTKKAHCQLLHNQTRDTESAYYDVSCQKLHLNPAKQAGWHVADSLTSGCHSLL